MEDMNLFGIIAKGGWLIIPIALCSLIMIAVIIERFLTLRKARINIGSFMTQIQAALKEKNISKAMAICRETKGPVASVFSVALEKHKEERAEVSTPMCYPPSLV